LLWLGQFLLNLAHELHVDIDVFIWLQLTLHGRDCENLFSLSLLHAEVKTDGVLTLILQVERQFFRFSNSDSPEV
jgi:hypothetical protein